MADEYEDRIFDLGNMRDAIAGTWMPLHRFDAWLAEHDRETYARAYEQGYHDGYNSLDYTSWEW